MELDQSLNLYKPLLEEGEPQRFEANNNNINGSGRFGSVPVELMSIDNSNNFREMDDSQLVGAPVTVNGHADVAPTGAGVVADVEMKTADNISVEMSTGKRKRGRPPRNQPGTAPPTPPTTRKKTEEEDVCFICFDGGSLVLCDRRGCPKAYHPACIKRDDAFFRSKAKWNCGWHICSTCQKAAHYMCYTCTYSLCKGCIKDADYVCVRGTKGFCGTCMRTIMLIENSGQGNNEMVQVDFDDKSSWEYLFKVYWTYLKGKISLTLDELTRAKNPWKGVHMVSSKAELLGELYDGNNKMGFNSDISCGNMEANHSKRIKSDISPSLLNNGDSLHAEKSGGDKGLPLPECTNWATKELLELVAHMNNGDMSVLSKFEVQALLLEYVKRNNLRDPRRKCQILCDSRLINLFGKTRVGHFEMLKLLEYHFLINENSPPIETIRGGVIDAVASQMEAIGNIDNQVMIGNDKRRKTRKKPDDRAPLANPAEYAAINVHNINLIYLRRNLMENLIDDTDKFHDIVVGSIVRIRISGGDQKQELYRLVQVVGTSRLMETYKLGSKTADFKLEILNLDKKELIPIDEISNQEFSEVIDECKRLRQSMKCGLIKSLKVGEIRDKAMTLQAIRVNDWLETEILRLSHLRDRASETGRRKDLRECVEKLQLLNSPEERQRRLHEVPEVHADPKMDPTYESEKDDNMRPKTSGGKKERGLISPPRGGDERGGIISMTYYVDKEGALHTRERVNESSLNHGREMFGVNSRNSPKSQAGPTSSVNAGCNNSGVVRSEAFFGATSETSPTPSTVTDQSLSDVDTDKVWHYQDPTRKVQGPFSMVQLRKWSSSGLFPSDLRIWRISELQDDSILLTDALNGPYSKEPPSVHCRSLLPQEVIVVPDDGDKNCNAERGGSTSATAHVLSEKVGDPNPIQNDTSTHYHGSSEFVGSDRLASNSSDMSSPLDVANFNNGQTQNVLPGRDSLKGNNSWPGQPLVCSSMSSMFSAKPCETPTNQVAESPGNERCNSDQSRIINGILRKIAEVQTNIVDGNKKQADCEGGQSSGQNWRPPPVDGSSNDRDSNSGFVSVARIIETTERNQENKFSDLPSPRSMPITKDFMGQAAETKQSMSPDGPVQDSGPSWSTASSLVAGGTQIPEVAGEWGGYSTVPAKAVAVVGDHAATPTSGTCQMTHSSPSHPAPEASGWQAIITEPNDFVSLADESVSDLLAEVEAMESLIGLSSPTSAMHGRGALPQDSENDCFSPLEGLSPALEPGKSDGYSSTGDFQMPSHLTVIEEPVGISQGDILGPQKNSNGCSPMSAGTEEDGKPSDVSVNQYEVGSDICPPAQSPSRNMVTTETTWRAGSESADANWGVMHWNINLRPDELHEGNTNLGWGTVQEAALENANLNSSTSSGNLGIWGSQTRYGADKFSTPREREFHGRDSGKGRSAWNRQTWHGGANGGGYHRPPPKGQRVCKYYESGYCKKGASCTFWHP
ncbi:SWIB domain-containing protein/GYF domain-containing protein/Plus-3 domain-containing protein [Cephalotus follicularis]|uniref:SWIB domain-containing protein/GYF domain-containing protein/Plus-3 domain-containing protein n=1 Tax=Cephalotus follicularis TaxID=3775 RepID=A0A1Q3C6L8_CEPFO|nr:SWIB domain-containing protein/GYF domain-containing protein/Plus-3 domain-containing protein [Cephalotus follicularis]